MKCCAFILGLACLASVTVAAEPLASWQDGPSKRAIIAFVEEVTTQGGDQYVPPAERIAVFDNDGTLWCEKPYYAQFAFALDRVKDLAKVHPEWRTQQPFKAVLDEDIKGVAASGQEGLMQIIAASHAGMTSDQFASIGKKWMASARHPKFNRPYDACIYQPMVELLSYLRSHGFKTYIVSGGGVDLIRVFANKAYGIPPEQVIGSTIKTEYQERNGAPVILRLPEIDFIDDKAGKPVAINRIIGRRPLMAFGNSDGDYEMLRYTTAGDGPRLGVIVRHTDAEREYAYDRDSHVGRLVKALDEAKVRGWVVVDMKNEWKQVFPEK